MVYFCEKYIKIISVDDGVIPFKLYDYQRDLLEKYQNNRFILSLQCRQSGKCVTGDTTVDIKFLGIKCLGVSVESVFKFSSIINKYKLLDFNGDLDASTEQQIYKDLLQTDGECSTRFAKIWGDSPREAKITWWGQLTPKLGDSEFERTLHSTLATDKNVQEGNPRTQEYDIRIHDDVEHEEGDYSNIKTVRDGETELCRVSEYTDGGGEQHILREDSRGTSTGTSREETHDRNETETVGSIKVDVGKRGMEGSVLAEQSRGRLLQEDIRGARRKCEDRGYEKENVTDTEGALEEQHTPDAGNGTIGRNSTEDIRLFEGEEEVPIDKTENVRCCEGKEKKREPQAEYVNIKEGCVEECDVGCMSTLQERGTGTEHETLPLRQLQDKKFIDSHILDGLIEVKSDTGWVDVNEVHKTIQYKIWNLKTESFSLDCADNHIVFVDGREVFVKDLVVGDVIDTENGPETVTDVVETDDSEHMYDLGVSHPNHRYYTNGVLSHNTQTTAAFFLWFAIFHETKILGILANKYAQAQEIMDRIRLSYEYLPFFIQPGAKTYNKKTLVFSNDSQIFCAATSSSSIRGRSLSLLYIDEAAFIRNCTEFYESTYPVIASGKESRVIMTTTPNGQRGMFYKLWVEALANNNEFVTHTVYWHQVPGRDEAWKTQTVSNTSPAQFRQEFDLEFRGSQNTLISGATLDTIPVIEPIDSLEGVDIYEEAQKGHTYMISVDTARGIGGDYSAFVVIDITTTPYNVVAKYRDNTISPMLYPSVIFNTALQYNNAEVLVEINDNGEQTVMILYHDFEYEQVMSTYSDKNRQVLGMHHTAKLGVRTTVAVKAIGCSTLNTLLEKAQLRVNDEDILTELGTFVQKGRSFEADENCHDDLVMCLVLFSWATRQQYFIGLTDIDVRNRIIDQMEHDAAAQLVPFGIIDNGVHDEPLQYENNYGIESVYSNNW